MILFKIVLKAGIIDVKADYDFVDDMYTLSFKADSYRDAQLGLTALKHQLNDVITDLGNHGQTKDKERIRPGSQRGLASRGGGSRGQEDAEGTGPTTTSD